jgi:hypothetical protein
VYHHRIHRNLLQFAVVVFGIRFLVDLRISYFLKEVLCVSEEGLEPDDQAFLYHGTKGSFMWIVSGF